MISKQKQQEYNRKYYLEHREQILLKTKEYRENHAEQIKERRKKGYEKEYEQHKKWRVILCIVSSVSLKVDKEEQV